MKTDDSNILDKWEFFKVDVAEFTKQYSKSKAKRCWNKIIEIQKILSQAMAKFNNLNLNSPTIISQIQDWNLIIDTLKTELEKESLYTAKGALLRSKMKWVMEGEKSTKYFLNLE